MSDISTTEKFLNSLIDDNFVKSKECLEQCVKEKITDRVGGMVKAIRSNMVDARVE